MICDRCDIYVLVEKNVSVYKFFRKEKYIFFFLIFLFTKMWNYKTFLSNREIFDLLPLIAVTVMSREIVAVSSGVRLFPLVFRVLIIYFSGKYFFCLFAFVIYVLASFGVDAIWLFTGVCLLFFVNNVLSKIRVTFVYKSEVI